MKLWTLALLLPLAACATVLPAPTPPPTVPPPPPPPPTIVQVLAINDFHGNLEPPKSSVEVTNPDGSKVRVPAGGAAHLATAAKTLRNGQQYSMTVAAGDLIGASPFVSAHFLDEPTIRALDMAGLDYASVGNHEFDKGSAELLRMQRGGCEKHVTRQPCRLEPFTGAKFTYLAANVFTGDGKTLFPGTAIKDFGPVQVGIVGMTLKNTGTLVSPSGVAGLTFADEAATANAAVPALKAAGADAIVLLIHEGARTTGGFNDKSCPGLSGDILPILAKLDPVFDVVVSGHTHAAYVCELPRSDGRSVLLTSAGRYGTIISDIRLTFNPDKTFASAIADNHIVQSDPYVFGKDTVAVVPSVPAFSPDPDVKAMVDRYAAAAAPEAARVIGRLSGPITRELTDDRENSAGALIADSQYAFAKKSGAQFALMNQFGVRSDLAPGTGGVVTYGQAFQMQPFGNNVVVVTITGANLKEALEQQFASGPNSATTPSMLLPSSNFFFAYDLSRPAGDRIVAMRLDGKPIRPTQTYRVAVNNFIASGGDSYFAFTKATQTVDAGLDLDALEAWLRSGARVPVLGRIDNRTPQPAG